MDPSRYVNPYIAGSPVKGTEMFFGREDVFSFVRSNLTGRHRDTPIVLYGQRRTGKTSALYQMHRHLPSGYRCIFIDLHGLRLDSVGNLLWGVANSIKRGLQRDYKLTVVVPDRAAFSADPYSAFEAAFLDTAWPVLGGDHLVLMIDEAVRLYEEVQAGRLEREVFEYFRHLMQHFDNLNFIFSIGSGLEEMEKEFAFLFSVSLYHRISFLEDSAARELITQPPLEHYVVTPAAVEKILEITSNHPYYTQLLCHCMFNRWMRSPKPEMTEVDVEALLTEAIELGSANLTYVWSDSTPEEQGVMAGITAAMRSRNQFVTVDEIQQVWSHVGVSFHESMIANAIRSLTSREVVARLAEVRPAAEVADRRSGAYSFTVDLQRLWLEKHRPLDLVKVELAEAVREWDRPAKLVDTVAVPESRTQEADTNLGDAFTGAIENAGRVAEVAESSTRQADHDQQTTEGGKNTGTARLPRIQSVGSTTQRNGPLPGIGSRPVRKRSRTSLKAWLYGAAGAALLAALLFVGALIPFASGSAQEALWQALLSMGILGVLIVSFQRPPKQLRTFTYGWNYVWFIFLALFVLKFHGTSIAEALDQFTVLLVLGAVGNLICASFAFIFPVRGSRQNWNIILPVTAGLITVGLVILALGNANGSSGLSRGGGAVLVVASFVSLLDSIVILAAKSQSTTDSDNAIAA
jgi:hypothetical protein